jgi:hypothetical protein
MTVASIIWWTTKQGKGRRYELGQKEAEDHRFSDFSGGSFHIDRS